MAEMNFQTHSGCHKASGDGTIGDNIQTDNIPLKAGGCYRSGGRERVEI